MRSTVWGLILLASVSLACGGDEKATEPTRYSDPDSPIRVGRGQEFTLTLESNATTGFSWRLGQPLDESRLRLVSSRYTAPDNGRVGAGGTETWTFAAVGRGSSSIVLEYVRAWETGVPPAKTARFSVEIT